MLKKRLKSAVQWYDNRPVTFLSTFVGAEPLMTAKSWCKGEVKEVPCPKVVVEYNKHMGGVDLLDSLPELIGAGLDPRNGTIAYFFIWLMLLWLMHG